MGYVTVWKFDSLGNYISEKHYGDGQFFYALNIENTCIRDSLSYVACGYKSIYTPPAQTGIMLYKFDANFDTLWTKNYFQDSVFKVANAITKCTDGGYAIVGSTIKESETYEVLDEEKAFVLRTDSLGNMLWYKTYGTLDYDDRFNKVVQTPDGGFLCAGATESYNYHYYSWYIVKVDALGNEEWYRTYGNDYFDDGRPAGLTITTDTSYIITGAKKITSDIEEPFIVKLDKNFELVFTKFLPFEASSSFLSQVKEIDTNTFIGIGSDRMNTANRTHTTLTKFDENFDIIWRKKYTVGDTTNTENYVYSIDTCSDGGYLMGGWASYFGQKLALIKTDSLGCDGTDWWECSTGVTIHEYASNPEFYIYPNPAAEGCNVFLNIEMDAERSRSTVFKSVEIYNLTGKLVKHSPLDKGARGIDRFQIDISNLEKGVYIIKIGQRTQKLMVE